MPFYSIDFKSLINETISSPNTSINGAAGNIFSKLGRYTSKTNKFITDTYVAEDDLWRIAGFEKELTVLKRADKLNAVQKTTAQLEKEAATIIRNTMPTYDLVPAGFQELRAMPFGNFYSFFAFFPPAS